MTRQIPQQTKIRKEKKDKARDQLKNGFTYSKYRKGIYR